MKRIAIFHSETLLGKEMREALGQADSGIAPKTVRLLTSDPAQVGTLTEVGAAAAMIQLFDADSIADVDTVFFCGPIAATRPLLAQLPPSVRPIVLSIDAEPGDGEPVVSGVNNAAAAHKGALLSPHPAVVLLAHLLHPLAALSPQGATATVILPASLYEQEGLEELFAQVQSIVTMNEKKLTRVFGTQLAFNLLPAAPAVGHGLPHLLARVLGGLHIPIQLIQSGVFHGVSASLFVRCATEPTPAALRRAFRNAPLVGFVTDAAHLGPIKTAGSDRVLLGPTRQEGDGVWLWATLDNLTRGGALNALEIAREAASLQGA
jgi:aspartate-semialdehyde dehydrogenase